MSSETEIESDDLRHKFSPSELNRFRKMTSDSLRLAIQDHIANDKFGKAVVLLETLVSKMSEQDTEFFKIRFQLASIYSVVDETKKSLPLWEALLKEARKSHLESLSEVLFQYGSALADEEEFDKANDFFEEGYTIAKTDANKELQATILHELSLIDREKGNFETAESRLREALLLRQQQDDVYATGMCMIHLAEVLESQHKTESAQRAYSEALEFAKKHDELTDECIVISEKLLV